MKYDWTRKVLRWLRGLFGLRHSVNGGGMIKAKRYIDTLVIHCAATPPDMNVGVKEIREWHKGQGWSDIGYHFVIRRDGTLEKGRPLEYIGAHVKGHNRGSVGVCLVGGVDKNGKAENNFTAPQWVTLEMFVESFKASYPAGRIVGHRDLDSGKECPSFDVKRWLEKVGL